MMPGNGNSPSSYGYGNPYSDTDGPSAHSYSPPNAMSYMAARAAANRASYSAAFPSSYGHGADRGPTYGGTYGPNSATAMGFGYGSRPPTSSTAAANTTHGAGRTTWTDGLYYSSGPPSADALRGAADMAAIAARMAGSGWPGTKSGTSYGAAHDVNGHSVADGRGDDNEQGNGNAWGHEGYNGNAWGHGGSGNGQAPEF
ncbi:hypothetical protein LZ31DRAFT_590769 [Colletotrichum somersetense]|nr:hypothetical protein LZ31DRAFT_590769 [Colletotrichum somersetense]